MTLDKYRVDWFTSSDWTCYFRASITHACSTWRGRVRAFPVSEFRCLVRKISVINNRDAARTYIG